MKKILSALFVLSFLALMIGCNEVTATTTGTQTNTTLNQTTTESTATTTVATVALLELQIIGSVNNYYLEGETLQLGIVFNPVNATNKTVAWTSSDELVATVTSAGLVTCVGEGEADITVTSQENTSLSDSISVTVYKDVILGLTNSILESIPKETNLSRWDVAWGNHPGEFVPDLFDLAGNATIDEIIWRFVDPDDSDSVLADAGYGAILNALEESDNETAGIAIYNKVDFAAGVETLEVIARGTPNGANGGDPNLSGAGQFRVSLLIPSVNGYEVNVLTQQTDNYPQDENGWISFEEPPLVDSKDAFRFDVSEYADTENIIVVIEANDRMDIVGAGDTNLADRVMILAVRLIAPNYAFGKITVDDFAALAKETNLARWDFAWGGQGATTSLIDFAGTALPTDVIWRGYVFEETSVFADAGYGAILNALEATDDSEAGIAMYNKVDFAVGVETLEVIARGTPNGANGGDPYLSGAGQFRVSLMIPSEDVYETVILTQVTDNYPQDENGWISFEEPPLVDSKDAFRFDVSEYADTENIIVVIEANDRMDIVGAGDTNLADRVIVLAIRLIAPNYVYGKITEDSFIALAKETNLARWDFAWGGQGATTSLIDFAGTALPTDVIWRGFQFEETSVIADAGYGAVLNAYETTDDDEAGIAMYNKTDVSANATGLVVVARSAAVTDVLSGAGAFRVVAYYHDGTNYVSEVLNVVLTGSQVTLGMAQDENGWVTFPTPPTIDADDLFTFDLSGLADKTDVVFVIEANDRIDSTGTTGSNLADRVIVLAVRIIVSE